MTETEAGKPAPTLREVVERIEKLPFICVKVDVRSKMLDYIPRTQVLNLLKWNLTSLASESERERGAIHNVINGMEQMKRELAADLGNVKAPVVSRTKKVLINDTLRELDVLLSCLKAGGTGKEGE
jgi:hypothetical protein